MMDVEAVSGEEDKLKSDHKGSCWDLIPLISGSQSLLPRPAALASLGNLLEIQIPGPSPRLLGSGILAEARLSVSLAL